MELAVRYSSDTHHDSPTVPPGMSLKTELGTLVDLEGKNADFQRDSTLQQSFLLRFAVNMTFCTT